jgi:hypothetical protein
VATFAERIESEGNERFLDGAVVGHGFTPYSRDYDVVIEKPAALPPGVPIGDTTGSYVEGRYRYRFTHCVEVHVTTAVRDDVWQESWEEVFTDYDAWQAAGIPDGFVWGVDHADAYPGLSYVKESSRANLWTERLSREMHEILIETNTFVLNLVCHDLRIQRLAVGDPMTRKLIELEAPETL